MSILDDIKSTLTTDLKVVEDDAHQIASAMIQAGEQSFSAILEAVLPKVKATPIGEIFSGVYEIYKNLRAGPAAPTPDA